MDGDNRLPPTMEEIHQKMISSFITKITSSSRQLARLLLEAHQWDVDAAVSGFDDAVSVASAADGEGNVTNPRDRDPRRRDPRRVFAARVDIPVSSSSPPPIRLRSPPSPSRASDSPPSARNPFSREEIQRADNAFDEQEHEAAKQSEDVERAPLPSSSSSSSSRRLQFRSVSDILSVPPQVISTIVTIWRNGFTLNDNPLSTLDDLENAAFLQITESMDSPRVLDSPDGKRRFLIKLIRRQQEDFPQDSPKPFQGVGRTLAEPDSVSTEPPASSDSLTTEPTPTIDPTAPTTSIKLILADGTSVISQFTTHHTIRDVRDFIDASTPDASRDYQLLVMGFPPTLLTADLDQTIEQAGISNSVLTKKF